MSLENEWYIEDIDNEKDLNSSNRLSHVNNDDEFDYALGCYEYIYIYIYILLFVIF